MQTPLPENEVIILASKKELSKDERINAEEKRLRTSYKDLPKDSLVIVDGLIRRAAYMRTTLEDLEKDLDENGFVELFSQSEKTEPYERERPAARLYNTINKNYQSIVKGLTDLVPKKQEQAKINPLEMFSARRDD